MHTLQSQNWMVGGTFWIRLSNCRFSSVIFFNSLLRLILNKRRLNSCVSLTCLDNWLSMLDFWIALAIFVNNCIFSCCIILSLTIRSSSLLWSLNGSLLGVELSIVGNIFLTRSTCCSYKILSYDFLWAENIIYTYMKKSQPNFFVSLMYNGVLN